MASPFTKQQTNTVMVAVLALSLLSIIGVLAWLLWPEETRTSTQVIDNKEDTPAPQGDSGPLTYQPDSPDDPEPEPEPEPEPSVDRTPINLPPLTQFRGLALEADSALAIRDEPEMEPAKLWKHADTLDQLQSRFAPYALAHLDGEATGADRANFESDAGRSFERPDVASAGYLIDVTPRIALWMREGVELPAAETKPPPEINVPYARRLQEEVNVGTVLSWLEAIEGEYGNSDYGEQLPLDCVIFPSLDAYLEFSRKRLGLDVPKWSAGYYTTKWDVMCMPVLDNTSLAEVIRHEMFHAVQAHKAPQSLLVPWFAEGSAEWLDKAPPAETLRTHPDFAAAAYGYLRTLLDQGYKLDLTDFLGQDIATFYENPELNYLLAYCFVDFCRHEEDLRAIYFEFWNLMVDGTGSDNAFARTFGGLDMNELQRRFLERIRAFDPVDTPPTFSHDALAEQFDNVPDSLSGGVSAPTVEGEISSGWYEVLNDLKEAGFDTSRSAYFKGDYDALVVAVDSSESMNNPITVEGFDFEAMSIWLYSLRYAGSLSFNRGENSEEIPPQIVMSLVDAVITNRVEEFIASTNIKVSDDIQKEIKNGYKNFDLNATALKTKSKRDLALHTAESVAWYWGTRQTSADVTVIDFNVQVMVESEDNSFKTKGQNVSSSPLSRLFGKTKTNAGPFGADGADTDWWAALQQVVNAASDISSGRVACMFFTDDPNSLGFYGHLEGGRDDHNYYEDQKKMAEALKLEWDNAGLGRQSQPSILQLFALPGAEGQGLDSITQQVPEAKLDEWTTHFVEP